jgi:hypothetical protein
MQEGTGQAGARPALPAAPGGIPAATTGLTEGERARVMGQAARSVARETARGYRSDWRRWEGWCAARGAPAMPPDPELVALYVTDHATLVRGDGRPAYAAATLDRWVAALSALSRAAGQDPPGRHPVVRAVLAGVRRDRARIGQRKRDPLLLDGLAAACAHATATAEGWYGRLLARRDVAVLCACWTGAFRRSELGALALGDASYHARDGLHVRLRKSKGDQEGRGLVKALPFWDSPVTCPVCAVLRQSEVVQAWDTEGRPGIMRLLARADEPGHACRPGQPLAAIAGALLSGSQPLFRAVHRAGLLRGPLSGHAVNDIIAGRCAAAGVTGRPRSNGGQDDKEVGSSGGIGGHSPRAGFVTEALRAGASAEEIARQTGQVKHETVMGYQRDHIPLAGNAVTRVGL